MIIDKKGKLFGKINIIDLCILLVIVVGISGMIFTVAKIKNNSSVLSSDKKGEAATVEVGLLLKEVRDVTRDAIIVGDEVFTTTKGTSLGKITKIESTQSKRTVVTDNGEVYSAIVPEKYDVTIYVETQAKKTETGYHGDDDVRFLYGKYYEIKTSTIKTTPMISSIKEVK